MILLCQVAKYRNPARGHLIRQIVILP